MTELEMFRNLTKDCPKVTTIFKEEIPIVDYQMLRRIENLLGMPAKRTGDWGEYYLGRDEKAYEFFVHSGEKGVFIYPMVMVLVPYNSEEQRKRQRYIH